jgi:cbb3-type cytochrome c oxidase subunit III
MPGSKSLVRITICVLLLLPLAFAVRAAVQADEGKAVFESKCVMCHGADGKSDTKAGQMTEAPDLTQPWKGGTSLADVEKLLREGAGKMPKYEDKLSDAEITAVATYVRELGGVE